MTKLEDFCHFIFLNKLSGVIVNVDLAPCSSSPCCCFSSSASSLFLLSSSPQFETFLEFFIIFI